MNPTEPLSKVDKELVEEHFPANVSMSDATVREILARLGRPLCEDRAKGDRDDFALVQQLQNTRGKRAKTAAKKAKATA